MKYRIWFNVGAPEHQAWCVQVIGEFDGKAGQTFLVPHVIVLVKCHFQARPEGSTPKGWCETATGYMIQSGTTNAIIIHGNPEGLA